MQSTNVQSVKLQGKLCDYHQVYGIVKNAAQNGLVLHTPRTDIIITSSRDASKRTRSFLNELELIIPNSLKINRGRQSFREILNISYEIGARFLLFILTYKGNPAFLELYNISYNAILLKYKFRISSISLVSDTKNKRIPRNPCINKMECKILTDFITDINLFRLTRCETYLNIVRLSEKECEIYFTDLKGYRIGPSLRLLIKKQTSPFKAG
jgi:U3 small nucleolar ribonucleoprotein protein IMP4